MIQPLESHETTQANKLRELYDYADSSKYVLVDDAEIADFILITDVRFDEFGKHIRKSPFIKRFTNKSFILSNNDRPLPVFRGILTSGEKSLIAYNRIKTCSYNAYTDEFKNKYISDHKFSSILTFEKKYFFSFIGRNCHPIRNKIFQMHFNRPDVMVEDSSKTFDLYNAGGNGRERQKLYYEIMLESKFALCPVGWGSNSYRLFEAMSLGVAPVIISDKWILPKGPFWEDFSIIIREKDVSQIEQILKQREQDYIQMGNKARLAFEQFFDDKNFFENVIASCCDIKRNQWIKESIYFHVLTPIYVRMLKFEQSIWSKFKIGLLYFRKNPRKIFQLSTIKKMRKFLGSV